MRKVIVLTSNDKYSEHTISAKLLPKIAELSSPRPYFYNVLRSDETLAALIGLSKNSELHAIRVDRGKYHFGVICVRPRWTIRSIMEFEAIFRGKKNIKAIFLNKANEVYGDAILFADDDFTETNLLDIAAHSYTISHIDIFLTTVTFYCNFANKLSLDFSDYISGIFPMLSGEIITQFVKDLNKINAETVTFGEIDAIVHKYIAQYCNSDNKLNEIFVKEYIKKLEIDYKRLDNSSKINTELSQLKDILIQDEPSLDKNLLKAPNIVRENVVRKHIARYLECKMITLEFAWLHLARAMYKKFVIDKQSFYMTSPIHCKRPREMCLFKLELGDSIDDCDAEYLFNCIDSLAFKPTDFEKNTHDYVESLKKAGRYKENITYF